MEEGIEEGKEMEEDRDCLVLKEEEEEIEEIKVVKTGEC